MTKTVGLVIKVCCAIWFRLLVIRDDQRNGRWSTLPRPAMVFRIAAEGHAVSPSLVPAAL